MKTNKQFQLAEEIHGAGPFSAVPNTDGRHVELITVTPPMAERWLAKNDKNRPLSQRHVEEIAREMLEGRWKFNGDTLRFAHDGTILDGQHRLAACVESGLAFTAVLVVGVDSGAFDTIDLGKPRNASDVLSIAGEVNSARLASALRFVKNYQNGAATSKAKLTTTQLEQVLAEHGGVRESVKWVAEQAGKSPVPFPVMAGCHYLFAHKDKALADTVLQQVIAGTGLEEGSPMHAFRERAVQLSNKRARTPSPLIAALFIKAWNQTRAGVTKQVLSFRTGGKNPEAFPEVR